MKTMIFLNWIAIGLPLLFAALGIVEGSFWLLSLLSLILTGFFQLVFSAILFSKNVGDRFLTVYFLGVGLFFGLCAFWPLIWFLPPALAIYMTWMLYHYRRQEARANVT